MNEMYGKKNSYPADAFTSGLIRQAMDADSQLKRVPAEARVTPIKRLEEAKLKQTL